MTPLPTIAVLILSAVMAAPAFTQESKAGPTACACGCNHGQPAADAL